MSKWAYLEIVCVCGWTRKDGLRSVPHALAVLEHHWREYCVNAPYYTGREKIPMGKSIGEIKNEKGIGGPPMLHGTDLPKGTRSIKVKVKELREAPGNFKAPAILDFEKTVEKKEGMAINLTNLRALAQLAGYAKEEVDNADFDKIALKIKGKEIILDIAMVNNPQEKKMVPSLFVRV